MESFLMDFFAEFGFAKGLVVLVIVLGFRALGRERQITRAARQAHIVIILEQCRSRLRTSDLKFLFDSLSRLRMSPPKRKASKLARRHDMARRNDKRYLGNTNTMEVHDLDNEKTQCQIDTIIRNGHAVYFRTLRQAHDVGYDHCGHCIGNSKR